MLLNLSLLLLVLVSSANGVVDSLGPHNLIISSSFEANFSAWTVSSGVTHVTSGGNPYRGESVIKTVPLRVSVSY
jgi:hypothetical protein